LGDFTLDLASKMKDSFLVALEEHHREAPQESGGKTHKNRKAERAKGKGKSKRIDSDSDADDEGENFADLLEDDSDDGEDLMDYRRGHKPYSKKSRRQRAKRSKSDNTCHVSTTTSMILRYHLTGHQDLLRQYLSGKGFKQDNSPEPPSHVELDAFEKERKNGPGLDNCRYDWVRPFSSTWNSALSHSLATDFCLIIKNYTHDPKWDNIGYLTKLISRKLTRVRKTYLDNIPPSLESSISYEQQQARNATRRSSHARACRRASRRHGVCRLFHLACGN
jgi:hypothetical protein